MLSHSCAARLSLPAAAAVRCLLLLFTTPDKARPHWGKCWSRVFNSAACPIKDLYPASNWAMQLSLQKQYDPAKLFETEMLSTVLARGVKTTPVPSPFCTNELGCYCMADIDCGAPAGPGGKPVIPVSPGPLCCKAAPSINAGLQDYKVCLPC
jgi:hypothetical protein